MLTYWKFKQIYKHTPYWQYVWNSFKSWFHGVINIPRATYLCIKYPFLYPRNRFNDLHYNNWKIQNFLDELVKKYQISKLGGDYENHKFSNLQIEFFKDHWYYFKQVSPIMISGWINWWAKPLHTIVKFYHDYILQIFHCFPTYTEWDCMEKGWKKAFGKQYLDELKEAAIKDGYLKSLRIMQLKEKWGRCQLYLNSYGDNVLKVIQKYEELSWDICIKCGKPATHTSTGWISPYCEECVKKDKYPELFVKRGTEEEKTLILY
jgi:hypothetical protein